MSDNIKTFIFHIVISFLFFSNSLSAIGSQPAENTPKLIVGIVVENMRPDYIQRYWDKFQENGFRKLYLQGAVCSNVNLNLHVQSYASGTATLFTGVYPNLHGIIDANWYDRFKKKFTDCTEDENFTTMGSVTKSGNASPLKLLSSTITDNLMIFTKGRSKVFSVAMNRESAIFAAGHAANGAYWFDEKTGFMVSGTFFMKTFPDWARIFNSRNYGEIYSYRNWSPLLPEQTYSESVVDNYIHEKGYNNQMNTFPHTISKYVKAAGNFNPLKTTPYSNLLVKDFTLKLLQNEEIGKDDVPDFVTAVFSSMDYENNSFGPVSLEMEDTYLYLDKYIGELIDSTQILFGKDEVLFFLTANTSASYSVEYLKDEFHLPVNYFTIENAVALLTSYLNLTFGEQKWIEHFTDLQIYLDHDLIKKNKRNLTEMSEVASDFMNQFEGILIAVPGYELDRGNQENGLSGTLNKSYSRNRSGDVLFLLKEGWQPTYKFKKVNYTDQSHIPLVFYGNGIKPGKINTRYNAVDLVPTLSELLKIPVPDKCQGKVIDEVIPGY